MKKLPRYDLVQYDAPEPFIGEVPDGPYTCYYSARELMIMDTSLITRIERLLQQSHLDCKKELAELNRYVDDVVFDGLDRC